ncbi:hypothetical protein L2E82_13721 [Cichorium intybus]|uniref:Uncharacterized protein n=1 Tax=Cichorium intybus TaxID=13427 RepID=A0ACB9EYB6_CICIN|nr:hypothetical protein L2E82_13721 [Cichorium intybus]
MQILASLLITRVFNNKEYAGVEFTADMEEAKNKDIANLQSPLKETEVQLVLRNLLSADNEKFQKTFRGSTSKSQ